LQLLAQVARQYLAKSLQDGALVVAEWLAPPSPQHSPELRFDGKAQTVVHALDTPVGEWQQVAAFAVRVVQDDVQDGDSAQGSPSRSAP
jgi:hypothetical protein